MNDLTPTGTITFICGVIMCIIGVATFVSAMMARARKDGQLEYKVDQILKEIDEMKRSQELRSDRLEKVENTISSHAEQIKTLFTYYGDIKKELSDFAKGRLADGR